MGPMDSWVGERAGDEGVEMGAPLDSGRGEEEEEGEPATSRARPSRTPIASSIAALCVLLPTPSC